MDPNNLGIVVNIILCVLSFILAAISVITVVITLKQNNKMLESSTRPYMAFRLESNQNGVPIAVLKNCGNSAATITKFSPSINFEDFSFVYIIEKTMVHLLIYIKYQKKKL